MKSKEDKSTIKIIAKDFINEENGGKIKQNILKILEEIERTDFEVLE